MIIEISELIWDEFNSSHIGKHNVTKEEVEQACDHPLHADTTYQGRLLLIGETKTKRLLSMVLARVKSKTYYVITARDSSRAERKKSHDKENN